MAGSGEFAVSRRGNGGVERFYSSAARREQHQQHQQHQKSLFFHQQQQLMLLQMEAARRSGFYPPPPPPAPPMLPIPVDRRNRTITEDPPAAALPMQPPVNSPVSTPRILPPPPPPQLAVSSSTNLDRFLSTVVPVVAAKFLPPPASEAFFNLTELWDAFHEWSVYGVEVPTFLKGMDRVDQYYMPSLSGIQLYVKPAQHSSRSGEEGGSEAPREAGIGGSAEAAESSNSRGKLLFEYMEHELPYDRKALFEKIGILASQFPLLKTCRSCDLHPSSWISIAWYPIYRIPVGNTLKDLDTAFLTLHHLSTHPSSHGVSEKKSPSGTSSKIALPVLGLAGYKLKGSLVSPSGPREQEQEKSLLQAFADWLEQLNVLLPDFYFFRYGRRYQMT